MKKSMWKVILTGALLYTAVVLPPASAYTTLGGKYASSTISYIPQGLTANYSLAMADGIAAWNNANVDASFTYTSNVSAANLVLRQDAYGANIGWNARTANKPVMTSGTYTKSDIDFNTSAMDGMTVTARKGTAAHELGHVFGLDHVTDGKQVMSIYGVRTTSVPGPDDIKGVNALY
ncbi:matrixin family metalloprotease [Paenibacillus radicis (ex Gao et al. 2016)]|uniref:Peptidase M10 metallopeptidase domain-containing protein n=1 Tax=Paenibacillus radicis (ex Gao et al. 2016) TaxID=1737354 RepID=A0A917HUT0_9BACL|nr:matrixin family metalloprotease [Paenibacillus radicis (ex Gao et al. 2016)]GGG91032.1 hypothetical protein GCM10010918_57640 [Paenibacillus radicis (ex Gao et al. 2016)]